MSPSVLAKSVMPQPEHEAHDVRRYVELEAPDEKVVHLEKVKSERLYDQRMDAWDVHTDCGRWWVITNPMNLYPQEQFQSLDYTLSFHVGVTTRLAMRQRAEPDDQRDRLALAWRRLEQAEEAVDLADESEEFQAVGMRCRESLLALVRAIADKNMVPNGEEAPKAADFIHWSDLIADTLGKGSGASEVRKFLKSVSKSTWQLVNWLTHASHAVRIDAQMAVAATSTVLGAFTGALARYESGSPDRCPLCSSYRIASIYRPDLGIDTSYVTLCESCGWTDPKGALSADVSPS